jgi:anti-sigma B factor antagonist
MTRSHPLAPGEFRADVEAADGFTSVRVRGELDLHTGAELWAVASPVIDQLPPQAVLVIDLTGLQFIDAAGIGVLVRLGNALGAADRSLQVRAECPTIRRVFEVTRLDTMLIAPALG